MGIKLVEVDGIYASGQEGKPQHLWFFKRVLPWLKPTGLFSPSGSSVF